MRAINSTEIEVVSGGFAMGGTINGMITATINAAITGAVFGGKYATAGNSKISLGWSAGVSEALGIIFMPWKPAIFGLVGGFFVPEEVVNYYSDTWIPVVLGGDNGTGR